MSLRPVLVGLACLALSATPAAAGDWQRVEADSGAFSVEVPCTVEESSLHTALNAQSSRVDEANSVSCVAGGAVFNAWLASASEAEQLTAATAFDQVLGIARDGAPASVTVTEATFSGRRALYSVEVRGAITARSGVIEVGPRTLLVMNAGGVPDRGPVPADIAAQLERFFASVEIATL